LIGPHAHSGFAVVGQTWRTLILAGLSSPTVPEGIALDVIGEDSVQPWTVRRGANCRFCKKKKNNVIKVRTECERKKRVGAKLGRDFFKPLKFLLDRVKVFV